MIALDRISVVRRGRALLRDVVLAIAPGEILALLGPNGAGKSTLVRVASGELAPDSGSVWIDGKPLASVPRQALARRRAVLPQTSAVGFPMTADEVVALGRSPHTRTTLRRDSEAAVERAMARADVLHLRARAYGTLSGGEQQRVHLARVFCQLDAPADGGTRCLMLDEPTASLDLSHQHQVLQAVRAMADDGVAVLAVLHDLNLAAHYADRIAILRSGAVRAMGAPLEVLRRDVVETLFDVSAAILPGPGGRPIVVSGPAAGPGAGLSS